MIKKINIQCFNEVNKIKVQEIFNKRKFEIVDNPHNADLVISVGGDGTFLRTLNETLFDSNPIYVGINTGHLGFLQDINDISTISGFIDDIKDRDYQIEELDYLMSCVNYKETIYANLRSLNETIIRAQDLGAWHFDVFIDDTFIGEVLGDGLSVCTPTGSTAYNMSLGGAIMHPKIKAMQLKFIAPINSNEYHSLQNGIIVPNSSKIKIIPKENKTRDLISIFDGKNKIETNRTNSIVIENSSNKIKVLKFNDNYWYKIRKKIIGKKGGNN